MDPYQVWIQDGKGVTLNIIEKATELEAEQEAQDIVQKAKKSGKACKTVVFDVVSGLTINHYENEVVETVTTPTFTCVVCQKEKPSSEIAGHIPVVKETFMESIDKGKEPYCKDCGKQVKSGTHLVYHGLDVRDDPDRYLCNCGGRK